MRSKQFGWFARMLGGYTDLSAIFYVKEGALQAAPRPVLNSTSSPLSTIKAKVICWPLLAEVSSILMSTQHYLLGQYALAR